MSEVKKLSFAKDQINKNAIELVEEILVRLKSGESVAFGFVEVRKARTVATGYSDCKDGAYHLLNSGAARLAARLANVDDD